MIGDCSYCGHSIAYHLPLIGCTKCSCGEFHAWARRAWLGFFARPR